MWRGKPSYSESLSTLVRVGREHFNQNTRSQNIKSPEAGQYHSGATSWRIVDDSCKDVERPFLAALSLSPTGATRLL